MKLSNAELQEFIHELYCDEKSQQTIEKYQLACRRFLTFADGRDIDKELVLAYKETLVAQYAPATVNAALSGINAFLRYAELEKCCVRQLRIQRQIYYAPEKELHYEEYCRLVYAAQDQGDEQLSLLLQTICSTGIRVSELPYITVAAARYGRATVTNKGKTRVVLLPRLLQTKLLRFAAEQGIRSGSVFITSEGTALDRSTVWRRMKELCPYAGVAPEKVFPHNLRHLFACAFYEQDKDPIKLADLLGHASLNTTRIYTAASGFEHERQLNRMKLVL